MTLKLGINKNISNEKYHSDREYISSSGLKKMLRDPEDFYKTYVLGDSEQEYNPAFAFGSYMHSLILEPDTVEDEYVIFDGAVRRGNKWDDFKEEHKDKTIITQSQKQQAVFMYNAYMENKQAVDLIKNGTPEETLAVEIDGIKIKVRCDYRQGNMISDVKTTFYGVSKEEVLNTCLKYDYDLSAALYVDAFTQHLNIPHEFYFIFINKKEPTNCEVYKASEQFIENGRRKYKKAIELLKKARETGIYYDEEKIKEIYIPDSCLFQV